MACIVYHAVHTTKSTCVGPELVTFIREGPAPCDKSTTTIQPVVPG